MLSKTRVASFARSVGVSAVLLLAAAAPAFADVEGSLSNVKSKLLTTIFPVLAVMGFARAGLSFYTGSPEAKQHLFYAIVGTVVGLAAQATVDLFSSMVH